MGETLRRGATAGNQSQFESDLTEAREMVKAARDSASTPADSRVSLLLTLLLSKDKERYETMLLSRTGGVSYETVQDTIQQLYAEREVCAAELRGWLGTQPADRAELDHGPCLAQAEQAAAVLGVGK
jgi:hypothetical protein